MSKRLQVLLEDSEYREIQRLAPEQRVTGAEWGPQALVSHGGRATDARRDRARLCRPLRAMIFVDSNIPMYLIGAPHANKSRARELLERCIADRERLGTDAG